MILEIMDPELHAKLYRIARSLGHAAHEAEDLAQDCILAYSTGGFRGESKLETWLYRVLWNKHVDLLRRKGRAASPLLESPAVVQVDAERVETIDHVRAGLRELPDFQRAVLTFRFFEELSYVKIAQILERPVRTLRSDCFRALEALHEVLERKFGIKKVKEWLT